MQHKNLKQQISSFAYFSNDELELIVSKFIPHSFKAKAFLQKQNRVCSAIHFISEGLVRNYYVRNDKEITTYLACDNSFISAYASFITQTNSAENIQCIEATKTLSISHTHMQELYRDVPNWQIIGRILAEKNYICMADRILKLQAVPAKDKYLDFLSTSSTKIIQRTPQIYIASFLGITPESLSRIRKSIS
ncbi:Crp/Fnr family transcriptional regulator [Lacibacter luteus]|uniref:Crp/Fnr family transcriptional regulator n=1 Tax=Lacibacter luteus TaxID=2508719 RepID=A0A4Q1CFF2_9BACT|nr:Crp/Fnr family transcriptional regulator [Lacibacter luteus]RXK58413.1 Crp/Fnr family transcriptional regulator [Lacibacter luteus]